MFTMTQIFPSPTSLALGKLAPRGESGASLMQLVEIYKEIERFREEVIKVLNSDVISPLEVNKALERVKRASRKAVDTQLLRLRQPE